ncbi:MAG: hypothetical protein DKINENOH_02000 [bacterium]|nr:hypothetical protein [bacterium]MCK6558353.1 DUF4159 domain-containing protein [bacterium]NUM66002.1 DUF4159 domain-containing protein [candidate division KSB1 bacterium]
MKQFCLAALLLGLAPLAGWTQTPRAAGNGTPPPDATAFTFTRVEWESGRSGFGMGFGGRGPLWAHDYPTAEQNLYIALEALTTLPLTFENRIVRLQDEAIFDLPLLYMCELGYWTPADEEVKRLREYLRRGGFLLVDDFRNDHEWYNFVQQMERVVPEPPQELALAHPVFHCFFEFEELGRHAPYFGLQPHFYAIFDEHGRMMALINYNNDIGDGWEWPENDREFSTEAFKLGINYLIYAMTH